MTTPAVIRPDVAAMNAYIVPDATGLIKLDAMENPFPLPLHLQQELATSLAHAPLHRYPEPRAPRLIPALREAFALPTDCDVLLGNGSDELIQIITQTVAQPGAAMLALEPSFVMYRAAAQLNGMRYLGVPLQADTFALDLDAVLTTIARERPALTFIAYPNNPTGNRYAAEEVAAIIRAAAPGLVVVDEAYQAFSCDSFVTRLGEFDNMVLMRTVSKLGLAGLRLGYVVGAARWLSEFDKVRPPYNINVLTQIAAEFALRHIAVFTAQTTVLCEERERMQAQLSTVPGLRTFASEANFILLRVADSTALYAGLKTAGILVKNMHGVHPLLAQCLRITIGTPEENSALLHTLTTLLK